MVLAGRGPLAVERLLLRRVDEHLQSADPATLLATPLRIIVPSQSLRQHVSRSLLAARQRGVAGVLVQTLFAAALEILERGGRRVSAADAVFTVLVRQAAEDEPVLRDELGELADGYASVAAAVADLLDAGFVELHGEILDEVLAGHVDAGRVVERARAVLRVAERTRGALRQLGVARSSMLLQAATESLQQAGATALPARAVLVHGFADATGVATDLLETLQRICAADVLIDLPPEPGTELAGGSSVHTQRLQERLGRVEAASDDALSSAELHLLAAPGVQAEVRAICQRIAQLIAAGVVPESIAVVVRDLRPYVVPLRTHLSRLGVPFSGLSAAAPVAANGRRRAALIELLRRRQRATADGWLDAARGLGAGSMLGDTRRLELRVGLRACGAALLDDVARLEAASLLAGRAYLPLPLRYGIRAVSQEDDGEEENSPARAHVAARRSVPGQILGDAIGCAQAMVQLWQQWPPTADIAAHLAQLQSLSRHLGWPQLDLPGLDDLVRQVPESLLLGYDDFVALLARATEAALHDPIGGDGGGVQVLTVMEARSRCWQHLFVAGMNRDVFPRTVHEDPLLPDWLRRRLAGVLPDIPIKARGFDEERFLFAQLLASSPAVTLSWQTSDDDGRAMAPSPLVERLRLTHRELVVEVVPPLYARSALASPATKRTRPRQGTAQLALGFTTAVEKRPAPRPAFEHAILAGAYGGRAAFAAALPLAMAEAQQRFATGSTDDTAAANARAAILAEIDPDLRSPEGRQRRSKLGPYFGFIGAMRGQDDRRRNQLFITTVEHFAACPWQTLVRQLLAIEPPPDPMAALPEIDMLLIGSTVHDVLERIVRRTAATSEPSPLAPPHPVPWPDEPALAELIEAAAHAALQEAGVALPGLARVLALRVRPYLAAARRVDWAAEPPVVAAVESSGALAVSDVAGKSHMIEFRADRIDRDEGALRLSDYKTGRPAIQAKTEGPRRSQLLGKISRGQLLQAAAYAHCTDGLKAGVERSSGRYVYLHPDADDERRVITIASDDGEVETRMRHVIAAVLQGWQEGSFFPRLVDVDRDTEPPACAYCDVAPACVRGDSGSRQRLRDWIRSVAEHEASAAEAALRQVWDLHREPSPAGGDT